MAPEDQNEADNIENENDEAENNNNNNPPPRLNIQQHQVQINRYQEQIAALAAIAEAEESFLGVRSDYT